MGTIEEVITLGDDGTCNQEEIFYYHGSDGHISEERLPLSMNNVNYNTYRTIQQSPYHLLNTSNHNNNNNGYSHHYHDEDDDVLSIVSNTSSLHSSSRFYYKKSVDPNSNTILDRLSTDEWISIILFCDKQDNIRLSETCRTLYILCTRDIVWKYLLQSQEEKKLLYKLKRDYQHLFPVFEFPEVRFVDFDNIHDHKRRYVSLKREVDKRLNKRLEYQSMESRFNGSSILKKMCYNCTLTLLWSFLLLLLIAMSATCVLFALYLDELLPTGKKGHESEGPYKVLIYSPLGFLITPFCIFLSFLICLCMGWVPALSDLLQKLYKKTDRSQKGKLDSVFERFLLAKNRSSDQRQTAIMKLARILPMQLFWFPTLLIMIGIKEFFFPKAMWTYFFIPVFLSMLVSVLDLPFQLYRLNRVRSLHSSHFASFMFAMLNIVLVYGTLGCAILLISLRMDQVISQTVRWSVIFIPSYIVMFLVWINAGLGFMYLASLSDIGALTIWDCMTFRDCRLASIMVIGPMAIMSLIIVPIAASIALLGYRLDGSKMKFYWVFAPMYIGFTLNAVLLVVVSAVMKILSCTRKQKRGT